MRTPYTAIPQNAQVTIPHPVTGVNTNFPSTGAVQPWRYGGGFGTAGQLVGASGTGQVLNPALGGFAHIINLISCAAAVYIYTNGGGVVQNVALFHAHTGDIAAAHGPMSVAYNVTGAVAGNTFVVFASSQEMTPNPANGIQTAARGLFQILADGVPAGNIIVITGTGTAFGADIHGNVGFARELIWAHGNLANTCAAAIAAAGVDYAGQFPVGADTLGFMGSGHNRANGAQRILTLTNNVNGAANDTGVVQAIRNFLNGPHSYKDGSLKLLVVRRLNLTIRGIAMVNVTPVNAQATGQTLLDGIIQGQW
jgi:hypothetical protein